MSSFADKLKELKFRFSSSEFRVVAPVFLFIAASIGVAIFFSFLSKNDVVMRTLAPKDTLVYLETNDLGNVLKTLSEVESFKQNSSSVMDFSVVNGMQVAVVIGGFETSENQVTDEKSVLNFKPKFTAIAETHAWSWQAKSLVENSLNDFVGKVYGTETKLTRKNVNGTERFIWTAGDGRKTFAVVSGSQVFFGNDEELINKCLSAKRGETENLLKNESFAAQYDNSKEKLAFGFVSNEGVRQSADVVGVSVAVDQSEDENARGFISRVLPQILKNTTKEISWTAEKKDAGIEDRIYVKTEKEVSQVLSETLIPSDGKRSKMYDLIPFESSSVTRYNLKNPQIAFRSLLLTTAKNTDAVNGKIISAFSNSLLYSYGIADAEGFLRTVGSEVFTIQIDDKSQLALAKPKDFVFDPKLFVGGFKPDIAAGEKYEATILKSAENNLSIAFFNEILVIGDSAGVIKSLESWSRRKLSPTDAEEDLTKTAMFSDLLKSTSVTTTFVKDSDTAKKIVRVLGTPNQDAKTAFSGSIVETRFDQKGIERRYISDFGFLGTIIQQFEND